jgi:hypothetical protein
VIDMEQAQTRRNRRNHSLGFKAEVAVAVVKGDRILGELARHFDGRGA